MAVCAVLALVAPASVNAAVQPASQFGMNGTGAGQFALPVSIAVGPSGDLYVGDTGTRRVNQFSSDGTFLRAWGFGVDTGAAAFEKCTTASTCQSGLGGSAAGQFASVDGLAALANGDLLVAEFNNDRVSQFTANGDFVRAWGFGVDTGAAQFETCTVASTCQQGVANAGLGGLANPTEVAIDPVAGRVLVVDFQADRVNVYSGATPAAPPADPPPTDPGPTDPGPTDPGPTDPVPEEPSNDIQIGKAKLNEKKGNAKLPVEVPGAGELALKGKGIKPASKDASGEGTVNLPVKPKGKTTDKLEDEGKAKVSVEVTFTPTGGDPNSESKNVKLKLD